MSDGIQAAAAAHTEEQNRSHQVQHRLLRLTAQVEVLERTLTSLLDLAETGQDQLSMLVSSAVDPQREQGLNNRLAELAATLQAQQEATERLDARADRLASDADMQALLASVVRQEQLTALEDRLAKLVRTQFKTNTLNESQLQQLRSAQAALHGLAERRQAREDEDSAQATLRLDEARELGRQTFAADFFPAIDGLELALENGRAWTARLGEMLAKSAAQPVEQSTAPATRWQKLRLAWNDSLPADAMAPAAADAALVQEMRQETEAWLAGLALVRDRFAGLLAAEGIQPIDPLGAAFDPRQHVAIEALESTEMPPNTCAKVTRKGYRQGERVLRYAEVVVARAPASANPDTEEMYDKMTR